MGVYVIGIPLGSVLILYMNKRLLFPAEDADEELQYKAATFAQIYGALFLAYDPKYWYFEGIVMIQKALLTGGLVLIAPGSSAQILVGLVVALAFYTIVLRTQPYEGATEDNLQSIATASTVMTLLIGFTLKVSSNSDHSGEYESVLMDGILIGLFASVGLIGIYMTLAALPCFIAGGEEVQEVEEVKKKGKKGKKEKKKEEKETYTTTAFKTTDNDQFKEKHFDASFTRDSALIGMRSSRIQLQKRENRLRGSTLAKMRISELTLVNQRSRSSSLGPPLPNGPPPTFPPRHSATPKIPSRVRESRLARMRISELTLFHNEQSDNPEMQARISNMRQKKQIVKQTIDIASEHSRQHALRLQQRAVETQVRLHKRLKMRTIA